jgi:thiamine biosynthesis lipoprotein
LSFPAVAAQLQRYEAVEPHMGTLFRIQLYAPDETSAKEAFQAAFARIAALDQTLSDYRPDSELNRVTAVTSGLPIRVSDDLLEVLIAAQDMARRTDGAFDATLGPVIRLWRQARQEHRLPDPDRLREAASHCGYRKLHVDAARGTLAFDQPGMQLDVGGIAKGWAAEAAVDVIRNHGIHSALVAASGDLAFSEAPPGQKGWRIGLGSADRTAVLSNYAVSTSGPSEQFLEIDGKRYSHIIDPATNLGLTRDVTVTVIAPHGAAADSLALAVSVLDPVRARRLIESEPGAAALVVRRTNGTVHTYKFGAVRMLSP